MTPRQAEFHFVADSGDRPLLPCIIDPFGKGSDLHLHGGIQLIVVLPVTTVLKVLTGTGQQFVIIKLSKEISRWPRPLFPR